MASGRYTYVNVVTCCFGMWNRVSEDERSECFTVLFGVAEDDFAWLSGRMSGDMRDLTESMVSFCIYSGCNCAPSM